METLNRDQVGHKYSELLNYLSFYSDELKMLKKRLDEICSKNTSKELLVSLEQFENRFRIQQDNIHTLKNNIQNNLKALDENSGSVSSEKEKYEAVNAKNIADEFLSEEKAVNDFRHEFNRFSAKWM